MITSHAIVLLAQLLLIDVGPIRFWSNTGHLFFFWSGRQSQSSGADQWLFTETIALDSGVNQYCIGYANLNRLGLPYLAGSL